MNTKTSPMSRIKTAPTILDAQPANLPVAKPKSPFGGIPQQRNVSTTITAITDDDVEKIGSQSRQQVRQTTDKVIGKMTVGKFDELGDMLTKVRFEVNRLDPASIAGSGITGWFQEKFLDIRKLFAKQFDTAEKAFDELETKMNQHIAVQNEWIRDLENLYQENFQSYKNIVSDIEKAEILQQQLENTINNFPTIDVNDPDAAMKTQALSRAKATLARLKIRIDGFVRSKALAESNAPKIQGQIETSRTSIMVLNDTIQDVIPQIKMDFVTFMASLDSDKALQIVQNSRLLANDSAKRSADGAKNAAVKSAQVLNQAAIETETLTYIRRRALETLDEVTKIQQTAETKRKADRDQIEQGQREYLQHLQQQGVV